MLLQIMAISISLSIDALGIGISYELKGVRIPGAAKLMIGLVSAGIMWLSVQAGAMMLKIFPEEVMTVFGMAVLCIIGLAFIRNSLFGDKEKTYDFDASKTIDIWEAAILGAALSADSVSAGIATSILGIGSVWVPVMTGLMQMFFLHMGALGVKKNPFVRKGRQSKICGVFSGCLLILIAVLRGFV